MQEHNILIQLKTECVGPSIVGPIISSRYVTMYYTMTKGRYFSCAMLPRIEESCRTLDETCLDADEIISLEKNHLCCMP